MQGWEAEFVFIWNENWTFDTRPTGEWGVPDLAMRWTDGDGGFINDIVLEVKFPSPGCVIRDTTKCRWTGLKRCMDNSIHTSGPLRSFVVILGIYWRGHADGVQGIFLGVCYVRIQWFWWFLCDTSFIVLLSVILTVFDFICIYTRFSSICWPTIAASIFKMLCHTQ